tara:strand:+ start:273 stop:437 length:165 start_codon:yes stop_codon:yes gene_type:complete
MVVKEVRYGQQEEVLVLVMEKMEQIYLQVMDLVVKVVAVEQEDMVDITLVEVHG